MALRTFLALNIDEATRKDLAATAVQLGCPDVKMRCVAEENLHVTLNFLGDVADAQMHELCQALEDAAAGVVQFDFDVRGIRCIPPRGQLRMIWADVDDPTSRLAELQEQLTLATEGLGLRQERREYRPHLTLARIKYAKNPDALRNAAGPLAGKDFGLQHAREVTIYTSKLTPAGPIYTPVSRAPLGQ